MSVLRSFVYVRSRWMATGMLVIGSARMQVFRGGVAHASVLD
jgi:hypothetical protein